MAKYKYILTVIITLCTLITYAQPAQYTPMTAAGYQMKRLKVDSTLHLPSFCGVPTLRGSSAKEGALAIDTCGGFLFIWTNENGWDTIGGSGGSGSPTDTTSLSNRINKKIDSLKRSSDSVFAWINGIAYFQYTDSVGSGGGDFWKINGITNLTDNVTIKTDKNIQFSGIDNEMLQFYVLGEDIKLTTSTNQIALSGLQSTTDTSTYKPLGIDTNGQLAPLESWVSGGGGGIDSLKRSSDSVYARKNGEFIFQFKDSVGTNPAPVGYYGAFQDTLTQSAASINTAYPVNLKVTDLSNEVAVTNNSKIKIANAGIYNIQFSLQLEKTGGSGNMIADIWLRKNGVNIDGTTGKVVLTGSANASPIVAAWNYLVAVSSNDSLELMWSTTNDNVVIKASPATSPHPSIPSAILTVTQQSGIMAGTGISPLDTANMLNPYLRKIDTATLSNRINLKLNISDTSTFQRKSIPSYTFLANNTTTTSNAQALTFKDTSGTYTGTPTWSTSAPTGTTNHSYRWTRIGNMVTLTISLVYGTASAANTNVLIPLPSDAPTPVKPAGLTAASNFLYPAYSNSGNTLTATQITGRGGIRSNSGNNGFEIFASFSSLQSIYFQTTVTYYTN